MPRASRSVGRQKIEMKLIENEHDRSVSLSKRYGGLFKKAGELATLCGVKIAIILFSVCGKPISYGSPDVSSVLRKFLGKDQATEQPDFIKTSVNSMKKAKIDELNREFNMLNEKLVVERKQRQSEEADLKEVFGGMSYEDYKSSINVDQLILLKCKLEEMKKELQMRSEAHSGSCSFKDDHEVDLSKVEAARDYLKL